jgi:hypothetical protein
MNTTEHLLICLAEECAEVQQAVSKALRFGLDDGYPDSGATNAQDITRELTDLMAVVELLEEEGVLEWPHSPEARETKKAKIRKFMEYARDRGALYTRDGAGPL